MSTVCRAELRSNAISPERAIASSRRKVSAKPLADLVGKAMTPVCRKRGFATVDVVASWPDIVGERYGERVLPERLIWPRQSEDAGLSDGSAPKPATLVVHTDGPTALRLSHETQQIIERINTFYGWAAVGRIKIVQRPVSIRRKQTKAPLRDLTQDEEQRLEARLANVEHDGLKRALARLGSQVIARENPDK